MDDNVIRRMRFACWVSKATKTHSEYAILLAFRWQQWFRESYIVSLVKIIFNSVLCGIRRT